MGELEENIKKTILSQESYLRQLINSYLSIHDSKTTQSEFIKKAHNTQGFIDGLDWVLRLIKQGGRK